MRADTGVLSMAAAIAADSAFKSKFCPFGLSGVEGPSCSSSAFPSSMMALCVVAIPLGSAGAEVGACDSSLLLSFAMRVAFFWFAWVCASALRASAIAIA